MGRAHQQVADSDLYGFTAFVFGQAGAVLGIAHKGMLQKYSKLFSNKSKIKAKVLKSDDAGKALISGQFYFGKPAFPEGLYAFASAHKPEFSITVPENGPDRI